MGGLGVSSDVIERCLNHAEQNEMKATYQQYAHANEMQIAWAKLGERLEALTSKPAAAEIVPIGTAKKKRA